MYGFWIGNLWLTLIALVALSSHSAIFGPAKYGMIPELVSSRGISRANGVINMMTNVAVIVGTLAAIVYPVIRPAFGQHPEKIFLVCCGLIMAGIVMFMLRMRSTLQKMFGRKINAGVHDARHFPAAQFLDAQFLDALMTSRTRMPKRRESPLNLKTAATSIRWPRIAASKVPRYRPAQMQHTAATRSQTRAAWRSSCDCSRDETWSAFLTLGAASTG